MFEQVNSVTPGNSASASITTHISYIHNLQNIHAHMHTYVSLNTHTHAHAHAHAHTRTHAHRVIYTKETRSMNTEIDDCGMSKTKDAGMMMI